MTRNDGIVFGLILSCVFLLCVSAYYAGRDEGAKATPSTVAAVDTTVVYRAILVPPPTPDTSIRYLCSEAKP